MSAVEEQDVRTREKRGAGRSKKKSPGGEMPLREHLTELRNRIVKSLLAIALGSIVGFMVYQPFMAEITRPVHEANTEDRLAALAFDTVASPFDLMLKVAMFVGLVVSSPIWLYQAWAFVVPGLKKQEKKYAIGFLAAAIPLFLLGILLGWLVMPQAVQFFIGFTPENDAALPRAQDYIDFVLRVFLAFGISMVLPVFLVGLNMIGVLPSRTILKHWRITVFVVALMAAIAAPGGDAISMFYIAAPLFVLFGISILICALNDRRRARRRVAQAEDIEAELASGPKPLNEI